MDNEDNKRPSAVPTLSDDPGILDLAEQFGYAMLEMTRQGEHWYTVVFGLMTAYCELMHLDFIEAESDEEARKICECLRVNANAFNDWRKHLESIEWPPDEEKTESDPILSQPVDWTDEAYAGPVQGRWLSFAAQLIQMGEERSKIARALLDTAIEMLICDSRLNQCGNLWARETLLSMEEYFRDWSDYLIRIDEIVAEGRRKRSASCMLQ